MRISAIYDYEIFVKVWISNDWQVHLLMDDTEKDLMTLQYRNVIS